MVLAGLEYPNLTSSSREAATVNHIMSAFHAHTVIVVKETTMTVIVKAILSSGGCHHRFTLKLYGHKRKKDVSHYFLLWLKDTDLL